MKPLFHIVVTICLVLAINAHPENIADVKELPQTKEPVVEAEESEHQARIERCTACSNQKLNVKLQKDILAAVQQLPGEVHTQQSFEGCSSEKGCAGIKVKDGKVIEKFGNLNAFKQAAAKDTAKEFTFYAAEALAGLSGEGPFWWMNQNSPFKNTGAAFEKYSKSSSSFSSTSGGVNLAANPFLNGDFSKLSNGFSGGFTSGGKVENPSSYKSSSFESSSFSTSNKGDLDLSNNPFLNGAGKFSQSGAGFNSQSSFNAQNGLGYTGSTPGPFTASTAGSNINLIQNGQKASEFNYAQNSQSIDEVLQSSGYVPPKVDLQQSCAGNEYVCVPKAQCNNGVVNTNGGNIPPVQSRRQYCNLRNEVCCKISATGQSNFIDTDSYSAGSESAGVYRPGAVGSALKPGIPYLPPVDSTNSDTKIITSTVFPSTFVTTPRPFSTVRPITPRPFSTLKPTYLPPVTSTSAPGYLPPIDAEPSNNRETIVPPNPPYTEGGINLDYFPDPPTRTPVQRPFTPGPAPSEIPAGCAAALKCTPIEFCTAEGVISNTSVILTRDQDAYRVPLTDCKDIATGRIGKCCRDPLYTDPWPTNQLGRWVPGVFGGNDGQYVPDSRGSPSTNDRPQFTARPPSTGSVILNAYSTTQRPTVPFRPNQITPGFPSTTVAPGSFNQNGQYEIRGQGTYNKAGVGQGGIVGVGQTSQGGQGQYGQGSQFTQTTTSLGQGQYQGVGQTTSQGFGQGVKQGVGQQVTYSQGGRGQFSQGGQGIIGQQGVGQTIIQGQGTRVTQGTGFAVSQGQGVGVSQGVGGFKQGQEGTQGQGFIVSQGQGQFVSQGLGQGVTQGQGIGITQGQGFGGTQGQGFRVTGGQGQTLDQGFGQSVQQNVGQSVSQGASFEVSQGTGQSVSQGVGQGVTQESGFGVSQETVQGVRQGVGFGVSKGSGVGVIQGSGQAVSQGIGQGVRQGTGIAVSQGGGFGFSQGSGQVVNQGAGFGVSQGVGQAVSQIGSQGVRQGSGFGITQGSGQAVSQGGGFSVTQGVGQGVRQGSGFGVTQGSGIGVSQDVGFGVSQGGGFSVSQGGGQSVSQGGGFGIRQGAGEAISQGGGFGFSQGAGQAISQGGGFGINQGGGFGVTEGQGQTVNQGQGQFGSGVGFTTGQKVVSGIGKAVIQGQGQTLVQGVGTGVRQGQGFSVSQGGGFGVENEYSESTQRVFLQRYSGSGQCGLLNPQKPYGNRNDLEVDFAEIPWQAMVLLQTNRSLLCGGVITRPDVVVTSASCVDGLDAKNVLIKGGEWKLGIDDEPLPFQIVQVKTILRHPEYRRGSLRYDAAILVLSENLRFANNIQPICLPKPEETLDAFYNGAGECIVSGWGKIVLQAHLSGSIMHALNVSLINPGECQAKLSQDYPHLLEQYDQDSCVCGQPTNPLNNICKVDIGSALACTTGDSHFVLRGVYSWDSGCQIGNQIATFYKFDLEWYEWAIGLVESVRFAKYTKITQSKISQVSSVKTTQYSGVKGTLGVKGIVTGVKAGPGSEFGQFSQGQFSTSGIKGTSETKGQEGQGFSAGQFGQFGSTKFTGLSSNKGGGVNFDASIKGPISNTFSAVYTEKKVFQSEPKIVTYTTKPEIVTFTTKPEYFTYTTKPKLVTYTTKPEIVTYTTKPEIVTFTTKPEYFTYTTKPKIVTYTTKPEIVTYTTKPQFISYETSGSGTSPQYVAPGVSFNPSLSDVVGKHKHGQCNCLEGQH